MKRRFVWIVEALLDGEWERWGVPHDTKARGKSRMLEFRLAYPHTPLRLSKYERVENMKGRP